MDTDAILELVRSLPRADFVARMPHPFLLVLSRSSLEEEELGFDTLVGESNFGGRRRSSPSRRIDVLEVVKAAGNPYPDRISIGRARNCDIVLRDPSVSKLHAHVRLHGGELHLVDLGSQNGTMVNDRILAAHRAEPIRAGDTLIFGNVSVKLVDAGQLHDFMR